MEGRPPGATFLPRLEATFLAIFHPVDGPKVLFQMPEDTFGPSGTARPSSSAPRHAPVLDFATLSEYVIPKAPLCGRLITCEVFSERKTPNPRPSYKVLGFPVLLQQAEKYQRNNFIFNLCFVLDSRATVSVYEPIVRKCGRALRALEEESSFVSRLENLPRLYGIVEQLYEDLNEYYETFVALPDVPSLNTPASFPTPAGKANLTLVDPAELDALIAEASSPVVRVRKNLLRRPSANTPWTRRTREESERMAAQDPSREHHAGTPARRSQSRGRAPHGLGRTVRDAINLKLFPVYPNPPAVHDWDVPVLLMDLEKHTKGSWDLTLVKLLPFINGVHHVKRLAQLTNTDISLVKECVEHLLYYSFAIVIDIFQFSNIYAVRPQIARMLDDQALGYECAAYVTLPHQTPLAPPELWRMYASLSAGQTLYEWADKFGENVQRIDIRRFVTFGIIKRFLRRVHRYPYLVYADEDRTAEVEADWPRRNVDIIAPTSAASAAQSTGGPARSAASSWLQFAGASTTPDLASEHDPLFSMSAFVRPELARRATPLLRTPNRLGAHRPTATAVDVASLAHGATAESTSYRDETAWTRPPRPMRGVVPVPIPHDLSSLLDGLHSDDELCVRYSTSWAELHRMLQWIGSPYASADVNRLLSDDQGDRSYLLLNPESRSGWASPRLGSARSVETGSYFSSIPGRARAPAHHPSPSTDSNAKSSSSGTADPFATRDVPSRVKILAFIKSRLQVKHYPSAWSCARDVVREEGVRGLFRGVTIPVVTITFVRTSSFSIYTGTKAWLEAHVHSNKDHELWRTGLYGALGGVTSGTLISCGSAPFELVKVQRQLEFLIASQRQQRDSPGAPKVPFKPQTGFQAAADIVRNHGGVRGFYMGFPLHITRDMIGTALYFGIYDTIRAVGDRMEARNQTLGLPRPVLSFLIGSSAGMLSWLLVYPVDLIKTQVQRNALAGSPKTSARAVFRKLLYEQGPAGTNASASRWTLGGIPVNRFLRLYRGLGISAVRSFISHGITWMLIESISRRLRESAKDQDTRTPPFDYLDFQ